MELQYVGYGDMDWIDLAQDRNMWRAKCVGNNEPPGSTKCGEFVD